MRIADVMTTRPIVAGADDGREEVQRLMAAARVHHLPLVHDGMLVGLWVATEEGPLVLLAPDRAYETTPGADALEAMRALLGGREAVVVWPEDGERPVGVLTRTDALRLLRDALARGGGRRQPPPVVVRLVGPAGAGKSALILRALERLRRCEVAVIQANPRHEDPPRAPAAGDVPVVEAPAAHWAKGFQEAVAMLPDAHLVLMEDRDAPPALEGGGLGEDVRVLVVPARDAGALDPETLKEAGAVALTRLDEAPPGLDPERTAAALRAHNPLLAVFAIGAGADDPGLADLSRWLEARALSRAHP